MHWVPVIDWSPGTEAIRSHVPVSAMVYHILCCNQRITQLPILCMQLLKLELAVIRGCFRSLSWLFLTKNNIVAHIMSHTWMWRSQMVMVVTVTSPYKRKLHPFALLSNMLTFSENLEFFLADESLKYFFPFCSFFNDSIHYWLLSVLHVI